jgi:hypothetical protein
MRKRLGEATWAERSQAAQRYLADELGPHPRSLSTTAWLAVARKA